MYIIQTLKQYFSRYFFTTIEIYNAINEVNKFDILSVWCPFFAINRENFPLHFSPNLKIDLVRTLRYF